MSLISARTIVAIAAVLIAGAGALLAQERAASGPAFTASQASRGQAAYTHNCRACHGDELDDGDFGGAPLVGSWFRDHWGNGDVADLFNYTKANMPPDNPGSLNDETYADVVAFILSRNGYTAGQQELPADVRLMQPMRLQKR